MGDTNDDGQASWVGLRPTITVIIVFSGILSIPWLPGGWHRLLDWMRNPANADAIQALSAVAIVFLTSTLATLTWFSIRASREIALLAHGQAVRATLPILAFSSPHSTQANNPQVIALTLTNIGGGPALLAIAGISDLPANYDMDMAGQTLMLGSKDSVNLTLTIRNGATFSQQAVVPGWIYLAHLVVPLPKHLRRHDDDRRCADLG